MRARLLAGRKQPGPTSALRFIRMGKNRGELGQIRNVANDLAGVNQHVSKRRQPRTLAARPDFVHTGSHRLQTLTKAEPRA